MAELKRALGPLSEVADSNVFIHKILELRDAGKIKTKAVDGDLNLIGFAVRSDR